MSSIKWSISLKKCKTFFLKGSKAGSNCTKCTWKHTKEHEGTGCPALRSGNGGLKSFMASQLSPLIHNSKLHCTCICTCIQDIETHTNTKPSLAPRLSLLPRNLYAYVAIGTRMFIARKEGEPGNEATENPHDMF